MKCPKCNTRMKKNAEFCPECGHKSEATDIESDSKRKKTKSIIAIVLIALVLIAIGVALYIILPTTAEVTSASISNDEMQNGEAFDVKVTAESDGVLKTSLDVPVYIDGNEVELVSFDFKGSEIKSNTFTIETKDTYDAGEHVLTVDDEDIDFTVLTAASFEITIDEEALNSQVYTAGNEGSVSYSVKNTGESTGDYAYDVSYMDQVIISDDVSLKAGEEKTDTIYFASDDPGMYDLVVDDMTYPVTFYEVSRPENGEKIMKNMIKGYSYFLITNLTGKDMVVYVVNIDDPNTALIARYSHNDEAVKVNSIVHGTYLLCLQTGTEWVPELGRFADAEYYISTVNFDLENNVYGGNGTYQYYEFDLDQELVGYIFEETDGAPNMVE